MYKTSGKESLNDQLSGSKQILTQEGESNVKCVVGLRPNLPSEDTSSQKNRNHTSLQGSSHYYCLCLNKPKTI